MRIPEVAKVLGVSREAAYTAAQAGQIPTVRIGRLILVPTAALRRLLGIDNEEWTECPGGGMPGERVGDRVARCAACDLTFATLMDRPVTAPHWRSGDMIRLGPPL